MKLGAMISDVAGALFQRPITERYPFERRPAPERLRGQLQWDKTSCTGCGLCSKDCPAGAIQMIVVDKAAKRFVMQYYVDRCTFCAQCVSSCRQGCLSMDSNRWELAALDRAAFALHYGDEADVAVVLAGAAADSAASEDCE
jgi:NAD(P)H-quinone oxidoreductase subunit I